MTKEELEKAEEYAVENWEHCEEGQTNYKPLKRAYLNGLAEGRKEICKKILEVMKHTSDERYIRNESFPFNFQIRDIEQIIYCLGVEL